MRFLLAVIVPITSGFLGVSDATAQSSASSLVETIDRIRTPARPFSSTATLTEYDNGKPKARLVLRVSIKIDPKSGQYRNLIEYVEPARDTGKVLLVSGGNYWFYDPAARSSIRISPQQRLLGQASVADVLSVNLSRDYSARLTGTETITDSEKRSRICTTLDLKAVTPQAAYSRIEYWIESGTGQPTKAKFYSDSGRLLKTVYYRAFYTFAGQNRPGEALVLDGVRPSLVTKVNFGRPTFRDIPEVWFQRDYLPRLSSR